MNPLLDTVKPCGWINQRGDYVEVARKDTVYGSHTVPLYSRPKVESLLSQCRKEARKEALLEAAEIAGKAYATFKATEQAHYRLSAEPFIHENFGFNISVVRYSQYAEDELRRMAEGEK